MAFTSIGWIAGRHTRSLWALVTASVLGLPLAANAQSGPLIISEFRLRGPSGATDEFVEIYNASGANHTVAAISGTGYGLAASDGVTRCSIPNGTVIPNRGHYLCVNSGSYSLGGYPAGNGTTATGDATFVTDIPDNAGLALFNNNTGGGSYTLANRIDAVGSTSEANTNYKEGAGYPALTPFSIDYSFTRRVPGGCTGSLGGNCTTIGLIQTTSGPTSSHKVDTDNNASDFIFVDTNGTSAGAGQRLGAPGPQNLGSPISLDGYGLATSKLDPCQRPDETPNQVRDFTSDPANNSTFGTLDVRRTFTNTTGVPITRLRFRVLDITTFPSISGVADLRPRTSGNLVVTVDRSPCGTGTSNISVLGTNLETPPSQPNGSGYNGSLSVNAITGGTPLAPGASVDVRFLLGIQQTGAARFCVAAETQPATGSQIACAIGPTDQAFTFNFSNSTAITIPDSGAGAPYPSSISVSGITARVSNVTVTLSNLTHTFADDVDVLLVGPTGVKFILLSDSGGSNDWAGHTYTFDSHAAAVLADASVLPSGTYRPANYGAANDAFAGPAPAGPYLNPEPVGTESLTTAFNGLDPNGTWSLYVFDDAAGDVGSVGGGWSIRFETAPPAPTTSDFNGDRSTDRAVYRPSTGVWYVHNQSAVQWGVPGDIPVAGDYDGDFRTDRAVYRPSTGVWYVLGQAPVQFGLPGDIPVPGDYNGAASTQIAVYRPSTGTWFVLGQNPVQWGLPGDIPVPGDYDGDGTTDRAVFRPSTSVWHVQGQSAVQWGLPGDLPVPGDYDGDLRTDRAVYRPSTVVWHVEGQGAVQWGLYGDIPVPGDYDGDGTTDRAVFRPSTGFWFVQGQALVQWGVIGDVPVLRPEPWGDANWDGTTDVGGYLGDFDSNGTSDIAIYRPSTAEWFVHNQGVVQWGAPGDIPVPGDYSGDGLTDYAVYRPSTAQWFVKLLAPVQWGIPGDVPVPGDYNGDGTIDIAVYRPSTGAWFVNGQGAVQWGLPGDVPVPADYNGDGSTDRAVYRPSTGTWFVQGQAPVQWGFPGDIAVPGDYNGDGIADRAVYRLSDGVNLCMWYVQGQGPVQWGLPGDIPVPGDFNGDGLMDRAVFRPSSGVWFVQGQAPVQWAFEGDFPASRAYAPR